MFDDPGKHLQRLERQLLEEEDNWLDQELAEAHRLLGDELPEAGPAARPLCPGAAGVEDEDDTQAPEPRKKGIRGLVTVLMLELLGIAAVAAYWLRYLL